jgi:hypothetical protein
MNTDACKREYAGSGRVSKFDIVSVRSVQIVPGLIRKTYRVIPSEFFSRVGSAAEPSVTLTRVSISGSRSIQPC